MYEAKIGHTEKCKTRLKVCVHLGFDIEGVATSDEIRPVEDRALRTKQQELPQKELTAGFFAIDLRLTNSQPGYPNLLPELLISTYDAYLRIRLGNGNHAFQTPWEDPIVREDYLAVFASWRDLPNSNIMVG